MTKEEAIALARSMAHRWANTCQHGTTAWTETEEHEDTTIFRCRWKEDDEDEAWDADASFAVVKTAKPDVWAVVENNEETTRVWFEDGNCVETHA